MTTVDREGATQRRKLACTAQVQASLRQGSRQKSAPQRHESVRNCAAGAGLNRAQRQTDGDFRVEPRFRRRAADGAAGRCGIATETGRPDREAGRRDAAGAFRAPGRPPTAAPRFSAWGPGRRELCCQTGSAVRGTGRMACPPAHAPTCRDRRTCRPFLTAPDNRRRWRARRRSSATRFPPRPQKQPGDDHSRFGGKQALGEV